MASNGYVRKDCSCCIFYESSRDFGEFCTLRADGWDADGMRWVSTNDCDRYPEIKKKHYEPCEHRVCEGDIKKQLRRHFRLE